MGVEGQSLTAEDQLFILMQAGLYLIHTRGFSAPEARICYERAESLCHSLNRPLLLYSALQGQLRYSLITDKLTATLQIAERIYSLAQEQTRLRAYDRSLHDFGSHAILFGRFRVRATIRACAVFRSGAREAYSLRSKSSSRLRSQCLSYEALSEWHLGEIGSCKTNMAEAIALAKELNDMAALGLALYWAGLLAHFEGNPAEVERLASDLIELCTRQTFASWLPGGIVLRGWAHSASGDTAEGISWIEAEYATIKQPARSLRLPYFLALKAEALHLADRTSEALEAIREAEALAERSEGRWWCAEMHRLRGVFLAAMGADETQIEASFCAAIRIAKEQKSISLAKRAEATYAEYRRQKASASGGRGFRLPLS